MTALSFWCSGIYRRSWRVADVADLARVCGAAIVATVIGAALHPLLASAPVPVSLFAIYGLAAIILATASRASYVLLRRGQRRASHHGVPVFIYGAAMHGIAAARDLFDDPATGLKPIGFVDDDPDKTGRLISGLPVLGRSYELDSLIAAHSPKAIVMASPAVSEECRSRIAGACGRLGIDFYRLRVQLDRMIEEPTTASRPDAALNVARLSALDVVSSVAAAPASVAALSFPALESEPCIRCGSCNVHRSRAKGLYERIRKAHTPARPFRCDDCGWRGWLLPLQRVIPVEDFGEADLRSLDAGFSPMPALGESAGGGHVIR